MKKSIKKSAVSAPAAKAPAKKGAPVKKKPAVNVEPPATFIAAKIEIGFGNHLFIRGEGPGLNWSKGLAMDCIGSDMWAATIKGALSPVTFKVLVNDLSWNAGKDYLVEPGQSVTVVPTF
ncbi:MAG TPA: hypothetical protein VGM73_04520 [Candidatus Didemnitutus sp.]|jgi:hypothetical protein